MCNEGIDEKIDYLYADFYFQFKKKEFIFHTFHWYLWIQLNNFGIFSNSNHGTLLESRTQNK